MSTEPFQFTCSECGEDFDPDPDTVLPQMFGPTCDCGECGRPGSVSKEDAEKLIEDGDAFTAEQLAGMNEYQLQEIGLTVEQRDKLLAGEAVETGAVIICKQCQDKLQAI